MALRKAVFLDKDGTVIKNVPFNGDPNKVRLLPLVGEGLQLLSDLGFELIIITNQPGISKGYLSERDLAGVHCKINELLYDYRAKLSGFYYCPHLESCLCKKPEPGLLRTAAKDLQIDLSQSWMIGDILDDVEAGNRAGCRTILIDNGNETEWILSPRRYPSSIASDLSEAASMIAESFFINPEGAEILPRRMASA